MWIEADSIILGTNNNKKEDTKMTTPKKDKLTFAEAMTIINNASTENKIEITDGVYLSYIIKIDDTNYIIYVPDDSKYLGFSDFKYKLHLNTNDTYNFTIVAKSPFVLLVAELEKYDNMTAKLCSLFREININIDILYDMVDTPSKIELDDTKLRNMLTKARFTGCLYELFDCGYGYTINNNNIIWYIPDDIDFDANKLYHIMYNAYACKYKDVLNHLDKNKIDKIDEYSFKDEITLNIHVVSNKKIFDTDFIFIIRDVKESYKILTYVHIV